MIVFPSRVKEVTVFPSKAKVTRTGRLDLPKGVSEISLSGLPPFIDIASLQVSARSEVPTTILGIQESRVFLSNANQEELERLKQALQENNSNLEQIKALLEGNQALITHCENLLAETRSVMFGLTNQKLSLEQHFEQVSTISQHRENYVAERKEQLLRYEQLVKEGEILKKQIKEYNATGSTEASQVVVSINLEEASPIELTMIYEREDCGWNPIYRLNLAGAKLSLDYAAEVRQMSGEDWQDVQLKLSTTESRSYGPLPELEPWFIQKYIPRPPVQPRMLKTMSSDMAPVPEAAYATQAMLSMQVEEMEAVLESKEYAVNFQVPYPVSMPSKDEPTRVNITSVELMYKLDLLVVPRLSQNAFRRLKIHNNTPFTLLPGQATVFLDGDYLGETQLKFQPEGSHFDINYGIDGRIKVKRELARQEVSKKILQERTLNEYGYTITLVNDTNSVQECQVMDEIPLSRNDDIKVHLLEASPKPDHADDLNRLTWNVSLQPNAEVTLRYRFSVEYPRDAQLSGLPVD